MGASSENPDKYCPFRKTPPGEATNHGLDQQFYGTRHWKDTLFSLLVHFLVDSNQIFQFYFRDEARRFHYPEFFQSSQNNEPREKGGRCRLGEFRALGLRHRVVPVRGRSINKNHAKIGGG